MEKTLHFKRILLKLSGETLTKNGNFGIDISECNHVANSIKELITYGFQIAIVIGAGNIFRGIKGVAEGMDQISADYIGMLSTIINGLALKNSLLNINCNAHVMSSIECDNFVEKYHFEQALAHLERDSIVILVGGTGNPFFTTDSAAALRACELQVDLLLKATKVDGVFDKDPLKHPDAIKFDSLSYNDVLEKQFEVIDSTAIYLCKKKQIPIKIFNFFSNNIVKAITEKCGTIIR